MRPARWRECPSRSTFIYMPPHPLCPAGHLPEIGYHQRLANHQRCRKSGSGGGRLISPLEGEMSGRTEGGVKGRRLIIRSFSIKMLQHHSRLLREAAAPFSGSRLALRSAGMTLEAWAHSPSPSRASPEPPLPHVVGARKGRRARQGKGAEQGKLHRCHARFSPSGHFKEHGKRGALSAPLKFFIGADQRAPPEAVPTSAGHLGPSSFPAAPNEGGGLCRAGGRNPSGFSAVSAMPALTQHPFFRDAVCHPAPRHRRPVAGPRISRAPYPGEGGLRRSPEHPVRIRFPQERWGG